MTDNNSLAIAENGKLRSIMRSDDVMERFAEILGKHNAPAYITSVLLAVANNASLQECSVNSIITSAMRAATLRLSCDPSTKQAHLVPFKGKATLVVGHKGFYDLAQRTNRYRHLNDFVLYEGQTVVENQLTGMIAIEGDRKRGGQVIGYGFYFELLNGLKKVLYMTVEEIDAHARQYSKSYSRSDSLWKTNFPAMAKKTVIRLCLSRYGYLDPSDAMALAAADEAEDADVETFDNVQIEERPRPTISASLHSLGFDAPDDDDAPQDAEYRDAPQPAHQTTDRAEPAPVAVTIAAELDATVKDVTTPLRYQPEQLRERLGKIAQASDVPTGQPPLLDDKHRAVKRGVIISALETVLSGCPDPKAARHQLTKYLINVNSLSEASDGELVALEKWLNISKDSGGAWIPDEMATREAIAAHKQSQHH